MIEPGDQMQPVETFVQGNQTVLVFEGMSLAEVRRWLADNDKQGKIMRVHDLVRTHIVRLN